MQFVFLIFVNIILWAVFYLVISLKLERSASEFREKKLKAQMDAILRDFNNTAERNISLLENRIGVMKKLLEQSGSLKRIDLSITETYRESAGTAAPAEGPEAGDGEAGRDVPPPSITVRDVVHYSKEVLHTLSGEIAAKFSQLRSNVVSRLEQRRSVPGASGPERPSEAAQDMPGHKAPGKPLLERNYEDVGPAIARGLARDSTPRMEEEELLGMFGTSGNKYELVAELYGMGYDAELLSRCSGIPLGEIKLVLNLQKQV